MIEFVSRGMYTALHRSLNSTQTMESARNIYPMRAVIRCKAKQRLLADNRGEMLDLLNETLFQEIAATLFQSYQVQGLYQPCRSKRAASVLEDRIATELAMTYRQISQQQQDPLVQRLNAML